jgi:hypothetical protein
MRIYLHNSYKGRITNEERLSAGEHSISEKVGRYLVDNGYAILIDESDEDIIEANEIVDDEHETEKEDSRTPLITKQRRRRK